MKVPLSVADIAQASRERYKDRHGHYPSSGLMKIKPYIAETKIGRNEPCHCGSGKKFKKCCINKS